MPGCLYSKLKYDQVKPTSIARQDKMWNSLYMIWMHILMKSSLTYVTHDQITCDSWTFDDPLITRSGASKRKRRKLKTHTCRCLTSLLRIQNKRTVTGKQHQLMVSLLIFYSLGKTCSHVAAVMFKVEAAIRIGITSAACTSEVKRKVVKSLSYVQYNTIKKFHQFL